jgi:nickel-dependent lactate racemase
MEYLAEGSPETVIDEARAAALVGLLLDQVGRRRPLRRVLVVPPDVSRRHSWAGTLTGIVYEQLRQTATVEILPAVGTHEPMTAAEITAMYPGIPHLHFHDHDWREGVVPLGEVPAEFIRELTEGRLDFPVRVEINRLLVEGGWDLILSVGQLVPHEVAGIANHNKNLFVGVGGSDFINKSHWLGAVHGMERIMGRARTPVRAVLDYASAHFARHLPVVYLLTVRARDAAGRLVTRGLFAGDDGDCFHRGAALCRNVNLERLDRAPRKIVVFLDPAEYKSTWLGNKAIYRTRLAVADGGEVVVLAPGVRQFGEDPAIDRLIRQHGYRGTPATLERVRTEAALAGNLSAAAHLIHGSTEGRFTVTYCPGGLTREETEGVGFRHGDLAEVRRRYPPDRLRQGWNRLADGEEVYYIANPGLGLWGTSERFDDPDA